jgi:hypothetical protein
MGFDVADQGKDKNANVGRHGFLVEHTDQWSGKGGDIFGSVERTINACDVLDYELVAYDADGLGAGVRGDARMINKKREERSIPPVQFNPYRGSGAVIMPKQEIIKRGIDDGYERVKGRTNEDYFANYKAQTIWYVRKLFMNTYRAITEGKEYTPNNLISISKQCTYYRALATEIPQYTISWTQDGKMVIDKVPDGQMSPNLADAMMAAFAPKDNRRGAYYVDED